MKKKLLNINLFYYFTSGPDSQEYCIRKNTINLNLWLNIKTLMHLKSHFQNSFIQVYVFFQYKYEANG